MAVSRAAMAFGARAAIFAPRTVAAASTRTCGASFSRRYMSTKYRESHEYVKADGGVGTIGITDFAQQALGDVVFVELPEVGDSFEQGESFGSVESVKAASDVYAPVSGEVVEVNAALADTPGLVNSNPMDKGWFIKIKLSKADELTKLMDDAKYKKHCDDSKH